MDLTEYTPVCYSNKEFTLEVNKNHLPLMSRSHAKCSLHTHTRKLWEVLDTSATLTVVMVSCMFAYVQTH